MQIVCPKCAASYQVSATAIGAAGRQVRCVRCREVWHQAPPPEVPPLAAAAVQAPVSEATVAAFQAELGSAPPPSVPDATPPQGAPPTENGDPSGPSLSELMAAEAAAAPADEAPQDDAAPALSDITIPSEAAPPAAPDATPPAGDEHKRSADIESTVARRRKPGSARRGSPMRPGAAPALILVLAVAIAALVFWRGSVVKHAPQLASLYASVGLPVNLRGLEFTDVKVTRETHDGVAVLVVEGSIVNAVSRPVEVPRLRLAMRSEKGSEIYAWTAMPTKEALAPGETLAFRSRLAQPPGDGRDVTVRFYTRHDAVAGLR